MKNLSIKLKLIGSFSIVAILISTLAIYSIFSISKSSDGFSSYREMARDTVLASNVQSNTLMTELYVKDYLKTHSKDDIAKFNEYYEIASDFMKTAKKEIKKPSRVPLVEKLDRELLEYKNLFDEVVSLNNKHNEIIAKNFKVNGLKIEKQLLSIMNRAQDNNNLKASLEVSKGLQTALFARLYTSRYVLFNTKEELNRVLSEFKKLSKQLIQIESTINNKTIKRELNDVISAITLYENGILEIDKVITKRNDIINKKLNHIGTDIAKISDQIKLSIKEDQDEIGPRVQKLNENMNSVIILISLFIFILVISLAIWIPRNISSLINSFQEGLMSFFKYLNKETSEAKLIEIDSSDEIGEMSKAVNKGIIKAEEIISKDIKDAWIKDSVNTLNQKLINLRDIQEISNSSIDFICTNTNSGVGVFYLFDEEDEKLYQYASFAHVRRDDSICEFKLKEGIVGQVAFQKKPIHLTNVKKDEALITTGTVSQASFNTYTMPLIHNNHLFAVIEIGSFNEITPKEIEFLDAINEIICQALSNAIQNQKIERLLEDTKESNKKLEENQNKLEEANAYMEEQQQQLEEANANMEEQQQQLEEANANMEEQQQQLKISEQNLLIQNKQLEDTKREIEAKAEELEVSGKYKSEFLANMSHELRTPLNSIILLSSLLQKNSKNTLNSNDIKKAKTIFESGNELLRLINDILDLSKVESGKMQVIVDHFKSDELLNQMKDLFEYIAIDKGLEFKIVDEYKGDISSDKDRISQIIRNLISNAFKFTSQGSITLKISNSEDKDFKISVIDTGIGIPKEKLDDIFKAFTQADGSTSREYGGTGLGLSISRELAKLLGGHVEVESTQNQGSSFSVVLPNIEAQDVEQVNKKEEKKEKPVEKVVEVPKVNIPMIDIVDDDRKILGKDDQAYLIIDDDKMFTEVVYDEIKKDGNLALIAHTATSGLELVKKYNIKGILLDLTLPDMNGVDVLKELKSNAKTRHIPVHIISSKDKDNETLELGAIGYHQKPVFDGDIDNIISTIDSFKEKDIKDLLIIEDDEVHREALIELVGVGVNIKGVKTASEAIEEVKKEIYDTVVVDLGLLDGSGYEVCEFIKNSYPNLPIIIYTGKDLDKEDKIKLQEYSNSIIIKTANSNERILNEINLFLHRENSKDEEESEESNDIFETVDLEGTNILIVDDDIKNIFVLDAALKEFEANTYTAFNGQEAIDFLNENNNIDLVLMDIMMPVMNGYEAIEKIRKDEKLCEVPIIAVTAKAMKEDREKCIKIGADDYLSKPIDINILAKLIKTWSQKKHK